MTQYGARKQLLQKRHPKLNIFKAPGVAAGKPSTHPKVPTPEKEKQQPKTKAKTKNQKNPPVFPKQTTHSRFTKKKRVLETQP